jgi:transposase InsO family protein
MSRSGNPYDNARAESFMRTLKCEEVYLNTYRDLDDAALHIQDFLERIYNCKRSHSSLGYLSPAAYELLPYANSAEVPAWVFLRHGKIYQLDAIKQVTIKQVK